VSLQSIISSSCQSSHGRGDNHTGLSPTFVPKVVGRDWLKQCPSLGAFELALSTDSLGTSEPAWLFAWWCSGSVEAHPSNCPAMAFSSACSAKLEIRIILLCFLRGLLLLSARCRSWYCTRSGYVCFLSIYLNQERVIESVSFADCVSWYCQHMLEPLEDRGALMLEQLNFSATPLSISILLAAPRRQF
jgi:hypothetical protein